MLMCAGPPPSELTVLSKVRPPLGRSIAYALTDPEPAAGVATSFAEYRCVRAGSRVSQEGFNGVGKRSRCSSAPVARSISYT
jgi:hypothetical protein